MYQCRLLQDRGSPSFDGFCSEPPDWLPRPPQRRWRTTPGERHTNHHHHHSEMLKKQNTLREVSINLTQTNVPPSSLRSNLLWPSVSSILNAIWNSRRLSTGRRPACRWRPAAPASSAGRTAAAERRELHSRKRAETLNTEWFISESWNRREQISQGVAENLLNPVVLNPRRRAANSVWETLFFFILLSWRLQMWHVLKLFFTVHSRPYRSVHVRKLNSDVFKCTKQKEIQFTMI